MNRAEIHELITDISERILKLNQNLAQNSRILPVELDLLRSYQAELERLISQLGHEDRARTAATESAPATHEPAAPRAEQEHQQAVEKTPEEEVPGFDVHIEEPETGAEPRVPLQVEDVHDEVLKQEEPESVETDDIMEEIPAAPEPETPAFEFNVENEETGAEPRVPIQVEEPAQQQDEQQQLEEDDQEPEIAVAHATEEEVVVETPETEEPVTIEEDETEELPNEPISVAHAAEEKITVETDHTDKPRTLVGDADDDEDEEEEKPAAGAEKKPSINDRFAKQQEPDLGYHLRGGVNSKNLRDMIDLSEKYVYARELFGGDTDYFERTLRYLNQCNSYTEAQTYINNELRVRFHWEQKQPIEQRFTKLLKAKFEN